MVCLSVQVFWHVASPAGSWCVCETAGFDTCCSCDSEDAYGKLVDLSVRLIERGDDVVWGLVCVSVRLTQHVGDVVWELSMMVEHTGV